MAVNEKRDGYKKTQLGWIPEEWEIKELGDFGNFSKGKGILKSELIETGIPCIRYGEIYTTHDYVIKNFYSFISPESAEGSRRIQKNDILFAGSGETLEDIGKSVVFIGEIKAYAGGDVIILRPKNINSVFLAYALNNRYVDKQRYRLGQGHSIVHIYSNDLKRLLILNPPLSEQKKIAEILGTWDNAIELTEKLIQAKTRRKKGLMQQLLTGKKRFGEFVKLKEYKETKLGRIPEEWYIKRLSAFGSFSKGKGISKSELTETGIPCIRYGEIYTNHDYVVNNFYSFIPPESAEKSKRIQKNDILFAGSGETLEDIGKAVAFIGEEKAYAGGDIIIFSPEPENVDSIFLVYALNNEYVVRQKYQFGQGHSVVHIYSKDLKELLVLTPSPSEQTKIAAVLTACDKELELLNKKLEALKQQKKGLMQKLLTGQIRVNTAA